MPKVSAQHSEARRLQIIDAAYRCFARKGFHQATMRDIFYEASLSPGAIYHYFRSKDDIIRASFEHDFERSLGLFEAALQQSDSLLALSDLFAFFVAGLAQAALLDANRVNVQGWGEALLNPDILASIQQVFSSQRASLAQLIRQAQGAGRVNPAIDPDAAARVMLSLYLGLELQMAWEPTAVDPQQYLGVVNALLHGNFAID
jgi:AcrR family transcriptional regulator